MKPLILNLKGIYFKAIEDLTKPDEFRLHNDYWKKRLINPDGSPKQFSHIIIRHGYPKADDTSRNLTRPWRGWTIQTLTHSHFGTEPVEVFAIKVN